jgi:GNAT superfamily N-acetyltransferase
VFAAGLERGELQSLVVDDPEDAARLVACGTAITYRMLPAPWLANGLMGFLSWFYTDPRWRGRGIARAIAERGVAWLKESGCTRVQLHAAPRAQELYRSLGFREGRFPSMSLTLTSDP